MAVSGIGVALATAGGVLVYAALKGESPLDALREIASGHPSAVAANVPAAAAGTGDIAGALGATVLGFGTPLVAAAMGHATERYSQGRRWEPGFSDCSSFVGKSLKDIGIAPPGASVTGDYLAWRALVKVPAANAVAGDLLVNSAHMAIVTGPGTAVGQQNPSRNVAQGPFSSIMAGTGAYLCLRYAAAAAATSAGSAPRAGSQQIVSAN
jgi:cell wall-associated NlpC family hydrolase